MFCSIASHHMTATWGEIVNENTTWMVNRQSDGNYIISMDDSSWNAKAVLDLLILLTNKMSSIKSGLTWNEKKKMKLE